MPQILRSCFKTASEGVKHVSETSKLLKVCETLGNHRENKQNHHLLVMNIRFLDGLRGIAALMVLIGHARLLLWEGYTAGFKTHPEAYSVLDKAFMLALSPFRYGHEMVVLFFILSGFVIHLRFANQADRVPMLLKTFWYKRLKRLYPPLLFAFLLTFVLDSIGKSNGWSIYFQQTPYGNINRDIVSITEGSVFLGNLLFLMSVYVTTFGSNVVTWSLMFEWWFYVLYPLFYALILKIGFKKTSGLILILFLISFFKDHLAPLLLWKVLNSFIIWWMGAALVEVWVNRETTARKIYALLPYGVGALPIAFYLKEKNIESFYGVLDFIFGIGFTGLIAVCLRLNPRHTIIRVLNSLKPLGDCSYTLYLIHVPIFVFTSGWLIHTNGVLPKNQYYVIIGTVLVTILAYLLHFIIEIPFTKSKKKDVYTEGSLLNQKVAKNVTQLHD